MGRDQTKHDATMRALGWRRREVPDVMWWDDLTLEPDGRWCPQKRHRNGSVQLSWPKIADEQAREFQGLKSEVRSGRAAPPSC